MQIQLCTSLPLLLASHFDNLDSAFGLTDSNGTLVSTYQYDPYGNLTSSTGSVTNPWRFAGGYFDSSTGLYKFGTRYYDAAIERWSQQDPLRGQLNDPTSLNRYLYAGDDPVNFTDPSGRDLITQCLIGAGVAFVIALVLFVIPLITAGWGIGLIIFMIELFFQGAEGAIADALISGCLGGPLLIAFIQFAQALGLTP